MSSENLLPSYVCKKSVDVIQPCSVENNESDSNTLIREEIVRKRKERRKVKQEERRTRRESLEVEKKLNKPSEKVQVISHEKFEGFNKLTSCGRVNQKIKKFREKHNLLDFIVERKKQARPLRRIETVKTTKLNKGKKREFPKKRCTLLKKIILKYRKEKKIGEDNITECVAKFDELKIAENSKPHKIHSRRFRPYCDNITSKEICRLTEQLLQNLFRYQKTAYEKNVIKARVHRRYVVGFKEVQRQIEIDKVKLVIFAPDCEPCDFAGGLDDIIEKLKNKCKTSDIPYLFSVNRRHLAYILFKKVRVSCVGILSYDGSQEIFKQLMESLKIERENYVKATSG